MSQIVRLAEYRRRRGRVYFTRSELSQLLSLYSSRVAAGEWKDYAIDHLIGMAVFSVFRHSYDQPAYAIAKLIGPRGPAYTVFNGRRKLTHGQSLAEVLPILNPHLRVVTD